MPHHESSDPAESMMMTRQETSTIVSLAASEKVTILLFFLTQMIAIGALGVMIWTRLAIVEVRVERIPTLELKLESVEQRLGAVEAQVRVTNKRDQ
jgi:hypothetical protein